MHRSPIQVYLVEDSPVALTLLRRIIGNAPDMTVVGWATSGDRAIDEIERLKPDVICTDLHMPRMDGLELTRAVMARTPRPILAISASVQASGDAANIFALLEAGAVDVFPKPQSGLLEDYEAMQVRLLEKIRILSGVKVFSRRGKPTNPGGQPVQTETAPPRSPVEHASGRSAPVSAPASPSVTPSGRIVAIGASTGGPQALQQILGQLPARFPSPILCVQHISEGFLLGLTVWLRGHCALPVTIAKPGELPQPGGIYFAPERRHLELDGRGYFRTTMTQPVAGHRPSATVTLDSIARCYGRRAVGVLLTGMGADGAVGLHAIAQAGGKTIAQDERTSVVFGMPRAAIELGAVQQVLPLDAIASAIQRVCREG